MSQRDLYVLKGVWLVSMIHLKPAVSQKLKSGFSLCLDVKITGPALNTLDQIPLCVPLFTISKNDDLSLLFPFEMAKIRVHKVFDSECPKIPDESLMKSLMKISWDISYYIWENKIILI